MSGQPSLQSTPLPATDSNGISSRTGPISLLLNGTVAQRLWIGAACVALFIATIATGYCIASKPGETKTIGLDFIAFYTGGTFVREGRSKELYDLKSVQHFQHDLAQQNGVDLGSAIGPYWNPPFYAWIFVPLSKLPYLTALRLWLWLNVACAALATALLCRVLARQTRPHSLKVERWALDVARSPDPLTKTSDTQRSTLNVQRSTFKFWGLVPVLLVLSTPFIHALSHAQNTCTSLLLLTLVVLAWRAERGLLAGLLAGLLLYKPQLGAILIAVLVVTLGWRPLVGMFVTAGLLGVVTLITLPGTLGLWLHKMPANLHFVIDQTPYLWERHVTLKAFWRLLLQGTGAGDPAGSVRVLTLLTSGVLGVALLWAAVRSRHSARSMPRDGTRFDRIVAATIVCTPLVMPFFFDYDQLLLAVPAVLFAAERLRSRNTLSGAANTGSRRDRWVMGLWACWYGWLMINPDVATHTRLNLTVPLLAGVASLLVARAAESRTSNRVNKAPQTETLAVAA